VNQKRPQNTLDAIGVEGELELKPVVGGGQGTNAKKRGRKGSKKRKRRKIR